MRKIGAESLREARRLIDFISYEYENGNILEVEPDTIKELMNYLRPLRNSNPIAKNLQKICGGAILNHKFRNFAEYTDLLITIVEIGKDL